MRLHYLFLMLMPLFLGLPTWAADIGQLFLLEHYGSAHNSRVSQWIRDQHLGGLVFWTNGASFAQVKNTLTRYHQAATQSGQSAPIFSIDHEGRTVQRLTGRHGFTLLQDPNVLGQTVAKFEQWGADDPLEVCELHGAIMALELSAVGFNSSLGAVADVYRPNRGARHMLRSRGISQDPEIVAACVSSILEGASQYDPFVYFTKHFPGLGSINRNTDVGVAHSVNSPQEERVNLYPYREAIESANRMGRKRTNLGIMTSNAYYPVYDQHRPAVESPLIQVNLLRNDLKFRGLVVTDALWVGKYEGMSSNSLRKEVAQIIIGGADLLMLPSRHFVAVYNYLQNFYSGTIPRNDLEELKRRNGFSSDQAVVRAFKSQVDNSVRRIKQVRSRLDSNDFYRETGNHSPASYTVGLRARYNELIRAQRPLP